jgi:exopolyphosphatase/guanosine-5'-triphosphate,3'-diphosphate pyrophosphatase
MRVGIVDVGSNTVRLLVASVTDGVVEPLREERTAVGLARDIEATGKIGEAKLRRARDLVVRYGADAAELGVSRLEVLVTAPGRQAANAEALIGTIEGTGVPVRTLTSEEEGRLAFGGVLASLPAAPGSITVCDVGGGSIQLVFGTEQEGPVWFRSLELGSLRLTQRFFEHDPPRETEIVALRREIGEAFDGLAPPLPRAAVATGGTARGLRRLVGRTLNVKALEKAIAAQAKRSSADLAERYQVPLWRAQTMLAGTLVLAEAQRRLNVPLVVARAGLREGAALELAAAAEAAA